LKKERYEVEGYEGDGVDAGFDARDAFPVDNHNSSKAEVDRCCEESRANGESYEVPTKLVFLRETSWEENVHQERGVRERVRVHLDPPNIPYDFQHAATKHADQIAPGTITHTK
jgi:hypothetical protein